MRKVTLLLVVVLVCVLGIGITAKAASLKDENIQISKEQYHMLEGEYMDEVRMILLEKGCKNAGVMLTYVTDAEGNREYTVTVHHIRLEEMGSQEWTLLQARIQEKAWDILWAEAKLKQI